MPTEFKLPELGEGIDSADVIGIEVEVGDTIAEGDAVIEVETDKASMDVPSEVSGKVTEIKISEGDTVSPGDVIILVESDDSGGKDEGEAEAEADEEAADKSEEKSDEKESEPETEEKESAESEPKVEAAEGTGTPWSAEKDKSEDEGKAEEKPAKESEEKSAPEQSGQSEKKSDRSPVFAAPSVRQFAREIGVNLETVKGTGPGGRISMGDVKKHARESGTGMIRNTPLPDFSRFGDISTEKANKVRQVTADYMREAWANVPHVTLFDDADCTELEKFRQARKKQVDQAGGKLTVTAILTKIVALGLDHFPVIKASFDQRNKQIIYKHYTHIGIAADTPRGLVVPVIRDVNEKTITDIAVELGEIAEKARDGKISPDDMAGGVFTITNLGGIGIGYFTPIVPTPQVAILGVGRAKTQPVWNDDNGEFEPRLMMPLSLSFDHRLVDGADGARFLRWLAEAIENPLAMVL